MTNHEAKNTEGLLEATATLKGMLGIGSAAGGDKRQNGSSYPDNKQVTKPCVDGNSKTKPEEKQKKKKKNKSNSGGKSKGGGKQSKQSGKNKNVNPKQAEQKGQNEEAASKRFAWSAFQSSPDASSLPIPIFNSMKKEEENGEVVVSATEKQDVTHVAKKEELSDVHVQEVNVQQEKIDNDSSGSYNAAAVALIQLLNGSNTSADAGGEMDRDTSQQQDRKLPEEKVTEHDKVTESVMENLDSLKISPDDHTSSSSGVNLAAMASATNSSAGENVVHAVDNSTLPPRMNSSQPVQKQPAHMNYSNPQYPMPPTGQQYPHQHASMMTIQIQVPENNGYMMVNAPYTGYPIPIQIPPGVRPGMVIPVNVPVVIPHGYPHVQPPMQPHMGSFPPQQSFEGQRYSQPAPVQKSSGPKAGTWAAKASAKGKGPGGKN